MLLFLRFYWTKRINLPPCGAKQVLPERCQWRAAISTGFQHPGETHRTSVRNLLCIWQIFGKNYLNQSYFNKTFQISFQTSGGACHRVITHAIIPFDLVKLAYSTEWNKYLFTLIFFVCILIFADFDSLRLHDRNYLKNNAYVTHIRKSIIATKQTSRS